MEYDQLSSDLDDELATMEDLGLNPFFIAMQKGFSGLKQRAAEQEWVICVPQSASLSTEVLPTADVLKAHILRPSPFFLGQFQTMTGIDVELREGRLHLALPPDEKISPVGAALDAGAEEEAARAAAASPRPALDRESVQVLSDDLAYTADYRAFRTMTIERPLVGPCIEPAAADSRSDVGEDFSLALWSEFIRGDERHAEAVAHLDGFVRNFNDRYTLVSGRVGMGDARRKVADAVDRTTDMLYAANPRVECERAVLRHGASELTLSGCYRKIFDSFVESSEAEEHVIGTFARAVNRIRTRSASAGGARSASSSPGGGGLLGRPPAIAASGSAVCLFMYRYISCESC